MSVKKISNFQIKLLQICKKYLNSQKKKNINISISSLCFFTIWAQTPGYYKILNLSKIDKRFKLTYTFKNLISISKNCNLKIFYRKKQKNDKDLNLIFSYSTKNDFDKNGNFKDRFFSFNSIDKNYYWILIALDNFVPKKLNENMAIIAYEKKIFKYSFFYFLKEFFKNIKNQKFSFNRIIHFCWEENNFSSKISSLCKNLLKNLKIKNFIINYEGVPFQNQLLSDIKKINRKIKTYGYLHCAPWPLQLDLIYKNQSLDNLAVSGIQQKNVLKKFLGWKKKKISVIPSLRFEKSNKREFSGYLFVPYKLDKEKNYLERLEKFLKEEKIKEVNKISVRIHPLNQQSEKHIKFKNECDQILSKYLTKKSKFKSKYSLFFGSATGVCIQALEEGTSIIHFPNNEEIDVFSNKFWPSLKIKRIGDKIFEYKIIKKNQMFFVKNENEKFRKYFLPLLKR
tara:strand:- start:1354 stop:2715 length:1362 start_codon:yes stop_codon:yes gene_type:complete